MSNLGNKEIMGNNIKRYLKKFNKSRTDLSNAIEVPYSTISDWINGVTYPRIDKIEMLANYFKIEKSDLVENPDSLTPVEIVFDDYFPLHFYSGLSAGSFEELMSAEPDSIVYVPIKFQNKKDHLNAFKVNGTSMNNVIVDGSIVITEDTHNNALQIKDGDIVVVFYNNAATVKRLYIKEDHIMLMPDSNDKSHMPITISKDEEFYIVGNVIWHMNGDEVARYY